MELEILGSGTSHGVPVIGCTCQVCASTDPHDNRMRASALLKCDGGNVILIDAGPEFRLQALRTGLCRLDALLVSHSHADHIHGLDDVRIFSRNHNLPLFANRQCIKDIRLRFDYIFKHTQEGGGKPHLKLCTVHRNEAIRIAGIKIIPIPLRHGKLTVLGWRIGDTAYLTDCNGISEESVRLLKGIKNLVIDGLRIRPHSTHFNFEGALEQINRINPESSWLTHICHDYTHLEIIDWLKINAPGKKIEPAYDGLRISIGQ